MTDDEQIAALTQKMLRKKFFVLLSKSLVPAELLKPFLAAHLQYMVALEQRGLVFASGPVADPGQPPKGDGMTVLRVGSAAEARAIAEGDPFYVNKLRTFELKEWTIMEGQIGLRVHYSDQTVEVT